MANYGQNRLAGCGVLIVIGIVVAIGFGIYSAVVWIKHSTAMGPFKDHVAEYLAAPKPMETPAAPDGQNLASPSRPIKGKIIVLDTKTSEMDWDVDLPAELKAGKPEEVGTVVLTTWAKTHTPPDYDDGTLAYVQECDVTVIDHASRTVICKQHFRGSEPPSSISNSSEGVGSKPTQDVSNYLKGLPHSGPAEK
jgi:hypothetical protein